MKSATNYIIYRDNPTRGEYHLEDSHGNILVSDPNDPEPVIQAALDKFLFNDPASGFGAGDIYMASGDYVLQSGFAGFNFRSYTRLKMDPTARISVPEGYAGAVFQLSSDDTSGTLHSILDGGIIRESGIPQRQWQAFKLLGTATHTTSGVMFNTITNTVVYDAGSACQLLVTGGAGFINANYFEALRVWHCKNFIDMQIIPNYQPGQQNFGIVSNTFQAVECQSDANLLTGINITGAFNTFVDVKVWDVVGASMRASIDNRAYRTRIIGGFVASPNPALFSDNGVETQLIAAT